MLYRVVGFGHVKDRIVIKGARRHNLRDISVELPRNALIVFTGVSGSGKSSLAFDTILAEGRRRYVESLSVYARQFLGQLDKPDVDVIEGLSPAIAIDHKTTGRNPRSTVGTLTEVYDHLRLLDARVGRPHCPECGEPVERQTPQQIVDRLLAQGDGVRVQVLAPVVRDREGEHADVFGQLRADGFSRVRVDGEVHPLTGPPPLDRRRKHSIDVVVDRLAVKASARQRLTESVETALGLAGGVVCVDFVDLDASDPEREVRFSERMACPRAHDIGLEALEPRLFSFNAPWGACPECTGLGSRTEVGPELVVPDEEKSLSEGAVAPWTNTSGAEYFTRLLEAVAAAAGFSTATPWRQLPAAAKKVVLHGFREQVHITYRNRFGRERSHLPRFEGVLPHVTRRHAQEDASRERFAGSMREVPCPACGGARLTPAVLAVTVAGRAIAEPRPAASLSGGEAQRIRPATQIGAGLGGVLYVLDEPSIGLHRRDNRRLIETLLRLRDRGNTVIVVEHDEETVKVADWVVDIGPGAGVHGGHVVHSGTARGLLDHPTPPSPAPICPADGGYRCPRRTGPARRGARSRCTTPSSTTCASCRSPCHSGSSSPSRVCPAPASRHWSTTSSVRHWPNACTAPTRYPAAIARSPVSRRSTRWSRSTSPRSAAAPGRTRRRTQESSTGCGSCSHRLRRRRCAATGRADSPFNLKGGRCEHCYGDGTLKVEMNFLPDVHVPCEVCHGAQYNRKTLDVHFKGRSITDVLGMTIEDSLGFFAEHAIISRHLRALHDVGLGHVKLGQPATTLSGGEAQRVKLAAELQKRTKGRTLYVLDEPTTGLHVEDVRQLLAVLHRLVDQGNTVVVIEHDLDVIKTADWIIDMGPEGGHRGGTVIAEGTPEQVAAQPRSYTGQFLRPLLERS